MTLRVDPDHTQDDDEDQDDQDHGHNEPSNKVAIKCLHPPKDSAVRARPTVRRVGLSYFWVDRCRN